MIINTNDMKRTVTELKKQHAEYPDNKMYRLDETGIFDPDNLFTDEYQTLCDRILAMDAIIYNASRI